MTSKGEARETSEFLRRRQLRLQQVREQSKDIAKKIRQRAKVEKLRQVVELDEKKERVYKQSQDKFVKKLEELYSRGLDNVGSSHKQARVLTEPGNFDEKSDLSHIRGKEAAAEVKRQKQQKLDELKRALERKVQAREAANILSREKSTYAANKLPSKPSSSKNIVTEDPKSTSENVTGDQNLNNQDLLKEVSRTDMGTQWDIDLLPQEWEPNIPALNIPQDDYSKEPGSDKHNGIDKQKKTDLFAISDEMPTSLRGGTAKPCEIEPAKLSSTIVSEYIQNRVLRLREPEVRSSKQESEDLKFMRQTILRSRPLRQEGSVFSNICRVVEGNTFPVPTWHPETSCQCRSPKFSYCKQSLERKYLSDVTYSNKFFSSTCPVKPNVVPSPVLTKARPFMQHKCCRHSHPVHTNSNGFPRCKESDIALTKKKSVTMYNHSTKDTRDVPRVDGQIVHRDRSSERDAYSHALSESLAACSQDKLKMNKESVNTIAVTRQNVEKEYKDTIAFLNSLPKHKSTRPIRNAFKDDHRIQAQRESRQRLLQQEFRNIEEESRRQDSRSCKSKSRLPYKSPPTRPNPPAEMNEDNDLKERDFCYSWMPVPDSDSKLAVHTIPTAVRPGRAPNVQFSRVDSYHEYRSRHKHTPPTKDTAGRGVFQGDSLSSESAASGTSSTDSQRSEPEQDLVDDAPITRELTDRERIIVYKILNYKHRRKNKPAKINSTEDVTQGKEDSRNNQNEKMTRLSSTDVVEQDAATNDPLSIDNFREGVYAVAGNKDNLESIYSDGFDKNQSCRSDKMCEKQKPDACVRVNDSSRGQVQPRFQCRLINFRKRSCLSKCKGHKHSESQSSAKTALSASGDAATTPTAAAAVVTTLAAAAAAATPVVAPAATSVVAPAATSVVAPAATSVVAPAATSVVAPAATPVVAPAATPVVAPAATPVAPATALDAGFVKLIDDSQRQQGNFYIGATGFLKHDAYEVIIQLRKNETLKDINNKKELAEEQKTLDTRNENIGNAKISPVTSLENKDDVQQKASSGDSMHTAATTPLQPDDTDKDPSNADNLPVASSIEDNNGQCPSSATKDNAQSTKTTQDVSTSVKDMSTESLIKQKPVTRPETSTCTQTAPSPPNPRPVYIHMSSSTSTAYMSPPEVVLPNCFRRGDKPCKKPRRSSRNTENSAPRNVISQEHHCKKYSGCIYKNILMAPCNDRLNFHGDTYSEKNEPTLSSQMSNKACLSRDASELCCKRHTRKIKQPRNSPKYNMSSWFTSNAILHSKRNKSKTQSCKFSSKSYLSPMIKQYIHKLLSLNREGIKAIQIINQDCSSVNTPGSSIINAPTNYSNKRGLRQNIALDRRDIEQLNNILKQRIVVHNNVTRQMFTLPDKTFKAESKTRTNINSKKSNSKNKRLHKVKSLNISKRIVTNSSEVSAETGVNDCAIKNLSSNARTHSSPPSDRITSCKETSDKNNIIKARKNTTELYKRHVKPFTSDDSSSGPPQVASSNSNSNDKNTSKPINISTQTSRTVDGEINYIKLAEDKLQNMEKIADLTEKCTKRLSNLAKVLEEVRKNKCLAYSQASTADSTSDSDHKSDKLISTDNADLENPMNLNAAESISREYTVDTTDYESLISGIPKPSKKDLSDIKSSENILSDNNNTESISQSVSSFSANDDCRVNNTTRHRSKPPPALLRINLKRAQDIVVPHELSTVLEVDSPLSVKFKQQSSVNTNQPINNFADSKKVDKDNGERQFNPESVLNPVKKSNTDKVKIMSSDSSEDSKLQMMDLNQFNEIMLRPFISLQEYARDHFENTVFSKRENASKDIGLTDDISSFHSDGSLPDVVAELLKRKLIAEPFRFDSNVNSTTISSESTLSVLALSKVGKDKTKSKLTENKENLGETSESLSISSNPDLENAFKKLGMGWASSTLKKTKERLALSSSSNTSSSSLSQLKLKNLTKQDEPLMDPGWSVSNISKKPVLKRRFDASKNAEQQTSFTNNMTVKEFLTKELSKKITFTDKSNRNDSNQEFVSLFETQIPEDFKNSPRTVLDDHSGESVPSGNNNRARTSTPVKLFKSVTYHSSSSSNMSNGLFSNADDLSSVKVTSASVKHQSASEKDELTIPNCSLKMRKTLSDCSKTDSC